MGRKNRFFLSEQGVTMHVCVLLCMQVGRGILDRFTFPLFSNDYCFEFACSEAVRVFEINRQLATGQAGRRHVSRWVLIFISLPPQGPCRGLGYHGVMLIPQRN